MGATADASESGATSPFPGLPYATQRVFKPGARDKATRPSGGRNALRYNPICTSSDLPCNGEPSDDYNNTGGWELVLDTVVQLECVELFVLSNKENTVCVGLACREHLEDLKTLYENSSGPVKTALWGLIRDPKHLEPCVPLGRNLVPPYSSLDSETAVAGIAKSFFLNSGIQTVVGDQFDTRQANGVVVRYKVTLISYAYGIGNVSFVGSVPVGDASSKCR